MEETLVKRLSKLSTCLYQKNDKLEKALLDCKAYTDLQELANYYRDKVFSAMAELRITIDQLETMTPSDKWPVPSYGDLLFSVR